MNAPRKSGKHPKAGAPMTGAEMVIQVLADEGVERYLRTARVQIMARVYGEFFHARGPTAELRDQMLGARTPQQAYEGINWLYGAM